MSNGLNMGINEFRALPSKEKLDCLYELPQSNKSNNCDSFSLLNTSFLGIKP